MEHLDTKEKIIAYSKSRTSLKLGGNTKHNISRVRKIKDNSLNNLISFYKGLENFTFEEWECYIRCVKEKEYRCFIKSLNLSVKIS